MSRYDERDKQKTGLISQLKTGLISQFYNQVGSIHLMLTYSKKQAVEDFRGIRKKLGKTVKRQKVSGRKKSRFSHRSKR